MKRSTDGAAVTVARRPLARERRGVKRVKVPGVVAATGADGRMTVGVLRNLSAGGALIGCEAPLAAGQRFVATVHAAGCAPLRAPARVVRRQPGAHLGDWALAFEALDQATREAVKRILEQDAPPPAPRAVIAVPTVGAPAALTRALISLRHEPRVVRSALEAAACVQAGARAVLVHQSFTGVDRWDLLGFLETHNPNVARIVIAGTGGPPDPLAHATVEDLSSAESVVEALGGIFARRASGEG